MARDRIKLKGGKVIGAPPADETDKGIILGEEGLVGEATTAIPPDDAPAVEPLPELDTPRDPA